MRCMFEVTMVRECLYVWKRRARGANERERKRESNDCRSSRSSVYATGRPWNEWRAQSEWFHQCQPTINTLFMRKDIYDNVYAILSLIPHCMPYLKTAFNGCLFCCEFACNFFAWIYDRTREWIVLFRELRIRIHGRCLCMQCCKQATLLKCKWVRNWMQGLTHFVYIQENYTQTDRNHVEFNS